MRAASMPASSCQYVPEPADVFSKWAALICAGLNELMGTFDCNICQANASKSQSQDHVICARKLHFDSLSDLA